MRVKIEMWVIVCGNGWPHTDGFCDKQAAENGLKWLSDRDCGPHRVVRLRGVVNVKKVKTVKR